MTAHVVDAAPFRALRYDPAIAGDPATTSAPAYDDLGRFLYARHRTASPYTVLELLTRGEGEATAFDNAAAAFRRWLRTGVLVEEEAPAFYLYEIHELRHAVPAVLRGILAAVAVNGDTLLPHERVEAARIDNRVQRMTAVPVDLAPVFAVHTEANRDFRSVVDAAPQTAPVIAFTDESGADHRIWALRDRDAQRVIVNGLRPVRAVIADGHHRFAAAVHLQRDQPHRDRTLVYLVDGSAYGPQLLPVHRLVHGVPGDLELRLREVFTVVETPAANLRRALQAQEQPALGWQLPSGDARVLIADDRALDRLLPTKPGTDWRRLDAAVFEHLVRPLLGAADVEYLPEDRAAASALVDGAGMFLVRPPELEVVYACALAGEVMPAKSTWFRPKPRAGVVMRSLDSGA